MTDQNQSARDDLAFVRALMSESGQVQSTLGQALLAGGACYGVQCLLQAIPAAGANWPVWLHLFVGIAPTLLFLLAITWISINDKNKSQHSVGTRAMGAAFGGAGLAAMATALIFGFLAFKTRNMGTWLLHPIMICVVQGVAWYTAYAIRRAGWFGLVAAGWVGTSLALTWMLGTAGEALIVPFLLLLAAALLGLMALPGWILMRSGARERA